MAKFVKRHINIPQLVNPAVQEMGQEGGEREEEREGDGKRRRERRRERYDCFMVVLF